jgi:hypothetical protein
MTKTMIKIMSQSLSLSLTLHQKNRILIPKQPDVPHLSRRSPEGVDGSCCGPSTQAV